MKVFIFILSLSMFDLLAWAQTDLVNKVYTGRFTTKNPTEARARILEQATEDISEDLIGQMIGEAKLKKNRILISNKIIGHSGRYIPVLKTHDILPDADGFKMSIEMQVSPANLEKMLLENGLLYDSEGSPIVLPMITFEGLGAPSSWWTQDVNANLKSFEVQTERIFQKRFFEQGFYSEKPSVSGLGDIFPLAFRKAKISNEDVQSIGPKVGAQIILLGRVFVGPATGGNVNQLDISITAVQVANGRLMAEVIRKIPVESGDLLNILSTRKFLALVDGIAKDLSVQILESWQKGTFGSTLAQIQVLGRISPNKYSGLKDLFKSKSRFIRQVRERSIAQEGVTFEVDISGPLDQVAKSLSDLKVAGDAYRVKGISESKITIEKVEMR